VDTNQVEQTRLLITAMFGKVFYDRLDMAIGAMNGDGAISANVYLGPQEELGRFQFRTDVYSRGTQSAVDARFSVIARVFMGAYLRIALESIREVNGLLPFSYGAGVSFDDEDIKLLFTLR
jgi:hypothetical protein